MKTDIHNNLIEFGSHHIKDWCVLDVIGDSMKVEEFLQGQLTSDIKKMSNNTSQLSSICNQKGQVITDFIAYKQNKKFKIIINKGCMDLFEEELAPFAKFFYTTFELSNDRVIGKVSKKDNSKSCYGSNDFFQTSLELCNKHLNDEDLMSYDNWAAANKLLGILFLKKEDSKKYRPLEINFDNLRVSFEKGCYRGQEIVARMKYLGINRRKFCTFITESDFIELSNIKILGEIIKLKGKKIFNAIVKRDELDEIRKLRGIIDIY